MASILREATEATISALDAAAYDLSTSIKAPIATKVESGRLGFRYPEKSLEQALVLKVVRLLSGIRAMAVLLEAGLHLDVGSTMRMLDEVGADIQFLAGPAVNKKEPEDRHQQFLDEFFQEEYDHVDPLQSSQSRHRVGRKHIRAYIARTYHEESVSEVVNVYETLDNGYSGYVHGAAVHVLETFEGDGFAVPSLKTLSTMRSIMPYYLLRALQDVMLAAFALGRIEVVLELQRCADLCFDEKNQLRHN